MNVIFPMSLLSVIILSGCAGSCGTKEQNDNQAVAFRFTLPAPDHRYELPEILHEISGIAAISDNIVACISDEKGTVYFYNLQKGTISSQLQFTGKGDFEDLTIIGDTIYVLDSNGTIWMLKNYNRRPAVESFSLAVPPPFEMEGLCHRKDTLFIAAKYYHNKKRNSQGLLPVWSMVLPVLQALSVFFFLPDTFQEGSGQNIQFHTSGILFDEISKEWLCISTHSKMMIRCDYSGNILNKEKLPATIFPQPEGICFTPHGDLLISNEGKNGPGTILLFHPK